MKVSIKKHKVREDIKWVVEVNYQGKRRRKFFKSMAEAKIFQNENLLDWLNDVSKKEPTGDMTILSCARDQYLIEYHNKNYNPAKPRQAGYISTEERVNKFINWFGEDRKVSEVTTQDWHDYLANPKWGFTTKKQYGNDVKMFMAWCGKQGYGQDKSDWYSMTNKSLVLTTKKKFHSLPGICSPEETEALLNSIHAKYRPTLAIMFFTGIRAEIEMSVLRYSDIQWGKRIGLKAEKTKTGRERWITPPESLWSWVPKGKGLINPVSYGAFTQARALAATRAFGFKEGTSYRKGFTYPSNGARHSFGSYGYWKDFEWALDTMGHMSSEMFLKNYKNGRVGKEESKEYFSIISHSSGC